MNKINLKNYLVIIAIIILASVLRFYKLGNYPALNADEAAIGYNAYSLILTGRDEHGNPWPIHFQSFNDYKPGFYFYLVIPFVKVFGLNEWAVRLPNAILGVASVYLIYLLIKELFQDNYDFRLTKYLKFSLPELSAFLLAISPWHIQFSRGGWEVNTATFLLLFGLYMFMKYVRTYKYKNLLLFGTSFILSLYTYHAERVVAPLLFVGLLFIFWKNFKKKLSHLATVSLIFMVLLVPLGLDFTKNDIVSRAAGVGLFADPGPIERTNEQRSEHQNYDALVPKLFHNKVVNYGLTFLNNWGEHYWGEFLFVSGDSIQRDKVPETGEMYLFEIATLAAGLYFIFRSLTEVRRSNYLILFWLVIAPIPAALTFQSPHALRAENMVIPLVITSSYGLYQLLFITIGFSRILKYIILISISILMSWNFARYIHMYYLHMSKAYPFSSQYGVKELVSFLSSSQKEYRNIVVTNRYDQPYILFLFYTKYPPNKFQGGHTLTPRDKYGFSTVTNFGNFVFKSIDWDQDKVLYPNSLLVGTDEEIPNEANVVKKIYGSNDYLYFKVVEN